MKVSKTDRGFDLIEFNDSNDVECSLQKSSIATDNLIWLGRDTPEYARMHLTKKMVASLLPYLQRFVDHGEIVIRIRPVNDLKETVNGVDIPYCFLAFCRECGWGKHVIPSGTEVNDSFYGMGKKECGCEGKTWLTAPNPKGYDHIIDGNWKRYHKDGSVEDIVTKVCPKCGGNIAVDKNRKTCWECELEIE